MPGNPVELVFNRVRHSISPAALHAFSMAFGVDTHESLIGQYFGYLDQILHGNLGISITFFPTTVSSVIRGALPWTLALVGVATVLSFVFGTLLGMVAATRRGTWVDALLPVTSFLSAVPYFWLGLVVLTIFARQSRVVPPERRLRPDASRSASPGASSRTRSTTPSCRRSRSSSAPSPAGCSGCATS